MAYYQLCCIWFRSPCFIKDEIVVYVMYSGSPEFRSAARSTDQNESGKDGHSGHVKRTESRKIRVISLFDIPP